MFWGLIMEPNKRYTQVVEKPFHISQAAMDISTGDNDPCQVMVMVDGKNFLVCTLQKTKSIQVPLDLYFKVGDSISFLINGKCNVHLTGYLDPEFEEELSGDEDDEDEEIDEEAPELVAPKGKRKLENGTDVSASKKAKHDKKAKKATTEESSSDEEDNQLKKLLEGDIDSDENDDSFKVNASAEASDSEDESDEEVEGGEDEEVAESSDEAETTLDTSKEEKPDTSKLSKSAKRRLKKKLQQQAKQPQVNGVEKTKKEKPEPPQKADKKEAKKEAETGVKKEKKSLSGGVTIEDLKVGNGPVAKPGKNLMVYYEGRLKQNNKMFDDCKKGPGFKFRLGAKEVISGWDVGISGMKVGGKRRIVCPPAMAYGTKGSPPVIPPNSTLVFEVELKNVK